jgi:hypothetical protein
MNSSENPSRLKTSSSLSVNVNNHASTVELQPVALCDQSKSTCESAQGPGEVDASSRVAPVLPDETSGEAQNITGRRFAILFACLLLGNFFVGYVRIATLFGNAFDADFQLKDTSCIATLTPIVTDQFQALNDLGWYTIA